MTLHIFNPEHDIALASNLSNFTAPHAGRQLRHDFGWLPVLWAAEGDAVLTDDVDYSMTAAERFQKSARVTLPRVDFVSRHGVCRLPLTRIEPWGWDLSLRAALLRYGCPAALLPSEEQLGRMRGLSSRLLSARLLPQLRLAGTVGESFVCEDEATIGQLQSRFGHIVVKAPWSSSGRGLRFLDSRRNTLAMQTGWVSNVLSGQGFVTVEPFYDKVKDFGMEFEAAADGTVAYLGLSLFHTRNGAYTGNLLATERAKRQQMDRYLPLSLVDDVAALICRHATTLFAGHYVGPFGVDMMVVHGPGRDGSLLLHPCVELNLRRTMGHVALSLTRLLNPHGDDDVLRVMRMEYSDNYVLKLDKI